MVSFVRSRSGFHDSLISKLLACGLLPASLALLAGCSADVARFDFSTASLAENNSSATLPPATEPVRARSNLMGSDTSGGSAPSQGYSTSGGTYYPPQSANRPAANSRFTSLEPPPQAAPPQSAAASQVPPVAHTAHALPERGERIEVQAGDTLYGLARRHHVPMSEIMALNDLKSPALKPGQQLYMPASAGVRKPIPRAQGYETVAVQPAPVAEAPPGWTGSYTVKSGDSLYAIARQNGVKLEELQRANGISDVRKVKPGVVLRLPGGSGATEETAAAAPAPSQSPQTGQPSTQPVIINATAPKADTAPPVGSRVAALNSTTTATDASPSAQAPPAGSGSVAGSTKLRWPVEGKVISAFGPRPDGTHNDGVNLAVPMGSDVHAAEAGVVAYAGSELKGYGNLVLLRHDNGWVTAYAHGDELLVKRGDKVKRGQVIAKAGRTGQVDQPQVHFELRQGQRPVDPTPFMDKM